MLHGTIPTGCVGNASEFKQQKRQKNKRMLIWLAVWLSGSALASISVVVLRQTRLVPGWVTVCGRVNYLGM